MIGCRPAPNGGESVCGNGVMFLFVRLRIERKNCTVKLLVKIARITQVYTSVHYTPSKWNKSNAFSMSGHRQCGLTNVVTYDWTSCYCMATVKPPMTSPHK
uniref:Uncharacterized protein n=1 Tax=Trichuris muris TaxID=70415 RepID=A0A5S6Q3G6_TRIMR